jgi:hypothetical protein
LTLGVSLPIIQDEVFLTLMPAFGLPGYQEILIILAVLLVIVICMRANRVDPPSRN